MSIGLVIVFFFYQRTFALSHRTVDLGKLSDQAVQLSDDRLSERE
jgi:hypothetical protein